MFFGLLEKAIYISKLVFGASLVFLLYIVNKATSKQLGFELSDLLIQVSLSLII
ncbi:MAG: hypothetical protein ABIJ81_00310 [Patescibacteria group bacterium]